MHTIPTQPAFASHIPCTTSRKSFTTLSCSRLTPQAFFGLFRKNNSHAAVLNPKAMDHQSGRAQSQMTAKTVGDSTEEIARADPAVREAVSTIPNTEIKSSDLQDASLSKVTPATVFTPQAPLLPPDVNTVLVVGASGKLGLNVARELLNQPGKIVIACVQSMTRCNESGLTELAQQVAERRDAHGLGLRPSRLDFLVADVTTEAAKIAECVRRKGVGKIVYTASGGMKGSDLVDNVAVGKLVEEVEPILGASGEAREFRIFDFERDGEAALTAFRSVDDRVMGGVSSSRIVMDDEISAKFTGEVTTARNGGFAQVRGCFGLGQDGENLRLDLSQYAGIALRCRGDGRRYKLNLKDEDRPEFAYQVSFDTVKDEWQVLRFPFSAFVPVRRGRIAYREGAGEGLYASTLDVSRLVSVGIVVSKIEPGGEPTPGFCSGSFLLQVGYLSAYRASVPRFVLVSSAAVTRPFWSEEKRKMNSSVANIPIVKLNPGNVLGNKLAGENLLRKSSIPWAIVRPTGLNDTVSRNRKLVVGQGDMLMGPVTRADIAKGIAAVLRTESTTWKTFEMSARKTDTAEEIEVIAGDFVRLEMDQVEAPYARRVEESLRVGR